MPHADTCGSRLHSTGDCLGGVSCKSRIAARKGATSRRGAQHHTDPYVIILHMPGVQITVAVARVLREFLSDPSADRYGYDLMQATSFPSGKLYPILAKLARIGWLTREREDTNPAEAGRPPRFYYRLTADGVEAARYELAVLSEQLAPPPRRPGFLQREGGWA